MLNLLIVFSAIFLILAFFEEKRTNSLLFCALSSFIGLGANRIAYVEDAGYYAYVPLAFVIVAIVYSVYIVYVVIVESQKKTWGDEVDEKMNVV